MIYKVKAINTNNGNVYDFELKRVGPDDFAYYDEALGEDVHPNEIADNIIREICNALMQVGSPLRYIKPGETKEYNRHMTFDISLACEE